jgi:hypothetical protein
MSISSKVIWGITALAVIIVAVLSWPKRHSSQVPTRDANTLDSLKFTQPTFHVSIDTLVLRETTYVRSADTLLRTIKRLDSSGSILHKSADSLAQLARDAQGASDAALRWQEAYTKRSLESDTLRRALFVAVAAQEQERQARIAADQRANLLQSRLDVSENLNTRLAQDINRAVECKFLWMRCPSRKATMVAGVVIGVAATYAIEARRPVH